MLMDWCELNLGEAIKLRNSGGSLVFDNAAALRAFVNVCQALRYLHKRRLVHCDIKACNVLLPALNLKGLAKLCDFSLTCPDGTVRDEPAGTAFWMAPELFSPGATVTLAADMWAMGCLLVELFAAPLPRHSGMPVRPWMDVPSGDDDAAALLHVMFPGGATQARAPPELELISDEGVRGLASQCLLADPEKRIKIGDLCVLAEELLRGHSKGDMTKFRLDMRRNLQAMERRLVDDSRRNAADLKQFLFESGRSSLPRLLLLLPEEFVARNLQTSRPEPGRLAALASKASSAFVEHLRLLMVCEAYVDVGGKRTFFAHVEEGDSAQKNA